MAITDRRYTKVSRDQILADLHQIVSSKIGPLADFGKSAYGQLIMELFAAHADTDAAWVEASFKDSFLETATSNEAIYAGARSLGYSVRRAVPAKAGFGIALTRTGIYSSVKVNIPKGTQFLVGGRILTLIDDVEFSYNRNDPNFENGLMTITSGRAVLAEGVIQNLQFFSNGNQNQEFIVSNANFSDWFGNNDPNYVEPDTMEDRMNRFTVVSSDASLIDNPSTAEGSEDKIYWRISRRGLQDPAIEPSDINEIDNFVYSSTNLTTNYTVRIVTGNDGRAKLEFGDGIVSAIPYGLIELKYFSTSGERGNTLNVAGSEIQLGGANVLITQEDGSSSDITLSDLSIALTTDIRNGMNIESNESIRKNAPKIYNALDSLHNGNSYILYLNKIAGVKYANAYGESILRRIKPKGKFDIRYSNIVRFTLLNDLYRQTSDGNYFVTTPYEYYIEGYKVNGLTYLWDYDYSELPSKDDFSRFNIEINKIKDKIDKDEIIFKDSKNNVISTDDFFKTYIVPSELPSPLTPSSIFTANLTPKDFITTGSELDIIVDKLNRKGYLTLGSGQHAYEPPIIHEMTMDLDVILFEGGVYSDIKTKIINSIYAYLKEYTEFSKPIFRSKIESLVQKMPEVAGLNLHFKSRPNKFTGFDLNTLEWLGESTAQIINQNGLTINGFDATLEFDYISNTGALSENETQSFIIGNQTTVRDLIKGYYNSKISTQDENGNKMIRQDLTEEDINKFTGYIWSIAMNEVYSSLFIIYSEQRANGSYVDAEQTFAVIEALKGWYIVGGELEFKDTNNITNMGESGTDNTLAFYKIYILDYIKLVRNILATTVSNRLIDEDGNVSVYSNQNEIVQFNISPSNILVTVGDING